MIGSRTRAAIAPNHRRQVQTVDHLNNKPRQVPFRKPFVHRWRKKKARLAIDRETGFLLPPSVDEWLPERHLARFVVEVIDGLDLSAMVRSYRGSGSASYHPALLLGVLVYGYATGVFSSRKLERATYDSVAFRFITANEHPDHDTIATFRRRFLKEIEGLFVRVLELAREMGMLKVGGSGGGGCGRGGEFAGGVAGRPEGRGLRG